MNEPQNIDEYTQRYKANERIFGVGLETSISAPCPFCAAPDFWVYRIINVREVVTKERICDACKRGLKTIFVQDNAQGSVFEFVQTTGPEQPAWLPQIRRLTDEERNHAG